MVDKFDDLLQGVTFVRRTQKDDSTSVTDYVEPIIVYVCEDNHLEGGKNESEWTFDTSYLFTN